jgi:hypothetical protein
LGGLALHTCGKRAVEPSGLFRRFVFVEMEAVDLSDAAVDVEVRDLNALVRRLLEQPSRDVVLTTMRASGRRAARVLMTSMSRDPWPKPWPEI